MESTKKPIHKKNQINFRIVSLATFLLGAISGYGTSIYLPLSQAQKLFILSNSSRLTTTISAEQRPIQVRFSPGGQCTEFAVKAIQSAQKSILVQAYSFTCKRIVGALMEAKKRGVAVKILVDRSQLTARSSKVNQVLAEGIPIAVDKVPGIAHNKIMIIDDAYVLTGSFNWTTAAEERNAENLLLIKDPYINELYRENWENRAMSAQIIEAPKTK